jgi:hypothetical protein
MARCIWCTDEAIDRSPSAVKLFAEHWRQLCEIAAKPPENVVDLSPPVESITDPEQRKFYGRHLLESHQGTPQ